ncbi:MAG: DNA/RNA non-specific endonuclease [Oscillospiraceae bacterium]|nr:DNA/RNA non-specific endonuclease [Oscillospiraceae bacterium]
MRGAPLRRLPSGRLRRKALAAKKRRAGKLFWGCLALLGFIVCGLLAYRFTHPGAALTGAAGQTEIPPYAGEDTVVLSGNLPAFSEDELTKESFVRFSPLDRQGRTGAGTACLGPDTLPTQPRGSIDASIRPSGWHTARYDDLIEDGFLYNRCHVIGYLLCGDNATKENLFTGTRHLNHELMLPYEKQVADCIAETGMHVLYRVTPRYRGRAALAFGVEMEAYSVEDGGREVCFHVFVYNVQPGIAIDYATGESRRA